MPPSITLSIKVKLDVVTCTIAFILIAYILDSKYCIISVFIPSTRTKNVLLNKDHKFCQTVTYFITMGSGTNFWKIMGGLNHFSVK